MSMHAARGFDGAKRGPRAAGWRAGGGSSTAEVLPALGVLRNRARDLVRNNPHIRRALKIQVANAIGTGVQAKFADKALQKVWKSWVKECDASGLLDFYGLQAQAYRAWKESGEVLLRFRSRLPQDGMDVPLQLQMLEIDYLDSLKVGPVDGGFIVAGVQFNLIGQRTGYWLFDQHPGEVSQVPRNMLSRFVPASEVVHLFDALDRPNSVRGFPWLASAIWKARDLDEYQDAELVRKKIEACFAAFVTSSDEGYQVGRTMASTPSDPRRVESLSPGMVEYLRQGESISFAAPVTSNEYESNVRVDLRALAAGTDTSYEQMTGDYSQVNFTSGRMGKMEFKRMQEQDLWLVFIPMFCEAVASRFVSTAYLAGKAKQPDADLTWSPQAIEFIDPLREANGIIALIDARLRSRHQSIRNLGDDPDEVDAEIEADSLAIEVPVSGRSLDARSAHEVLDRLEQLLSAVP
ncbi:phage portal protein [Paraburkholderia strydomiana]|uniref:phage portal protein n=1 Tax=Paraburkholderia strydomiana TaxID=1245417 RepID=UPI0038B80951